MITEPILLVDDEEYLRSSLKEGLARDGYFVEDAPDAASALALLADRHYPVVLTDLNMPGGPTGFDLIAAVKAHDPLTLCVVITGFASMETAIQAVKFGAYDFVQKPFKLAEIEAVLNRALEHAAVLAQLRDYQEALEERVVARLRDLTQLHEEVLKLNDLLIASQRMLEEGPILELFLAHLKERFAPAECLALVPAPGDAWQGLSGARPSELALPPPSALRSHREWPWKDGRSEGHLIPLRSGELTLGALYLGFDERSGFQPEDPSFVLWRRQLEAALHGLCRTRDQVVLERQRGRQS
jgi:FixJ family two-component response regulator